MFILKKKMYRISEIEITKGTWTKDHETVIR
jgi:hypothetical protein